MCAVYKRELKIYFYSPIAYVVIGLFLFLSSMFFSNLLYEGNTDYNGILNSMGFIAIFLVPLLTMRSIAEDRKNGIDVIFFSTPQSTANIVLGKFFALLTVFGIAILLTVIYPLVLFVYGNPFITQIIGGYIGFILIISTFISIGLFCSALTENQIIAAVVAFVMLMFMWVIDLLANYASGIVKEILNWFSLISRLREFNIGILNLSNIIYYLSFIIVFVFITIAIIEKRKFRDDEKLKDGLNFVIPISSAIIIAVLVNILISPVVLKKVIGKDTLKWDMTPNKQYSVGGETNKVLQGLTKDVEIYVLYNDDATQHSDEKSIMEFLGKYEEYGHVKVQKVNPDKNPGIIAKIDPDNAYDLHEDNIVIKCGKNIKKYFTQQLYMEDSYEANGTNKWDGEQVITGGIKYVISDEKHVVYFTTGHSERKLLGEFKILNSYIEKNNFETKSLNLMGIEEIPSDADIIVFPSPQKDITTEEKDKMAHYLSKGGKTIFLFDYLDSTIPFSNFEELMKDYSISLDYNKIKESQVNSAPKSFYSLVVLPGRNTVTSPIIWNMNKILMPDCRSINILPNQNEKLTITSLINTSKEAVGEQVDKSKRDIEGPLQLAVAVENKVGEKTSKIAVIGNCRFVADDVVNQSPFAVNFFLNIVNWMQNNQREVTIEPKSLDFGTLQINKSQADILNICLIAVFPVVILIIGLIVWLRRRHL